MTRILFLLITFALISSCSSKKSYPEGSRDIASTSKKLTCKYFSGVDGVPTLIEFTVLNKNLMVKIGAIDIPDWQKEFQVIKVVKEKGVLQLFTEISQKSKSYTSPGSDVLTIRNDRQTWLEFDDRNVFLKNKTFSQGGLGKSNDTSDVFVGNFEQICDFEMNQLEDFIEKTEL